MVIGGYPITPRSNQALCPQPGGGIELAAPVGSYADPALCLEARPFDAVVALGQYLVRDLQQAQQSDQPKTADYIAEHRKGEESNQSR